jgi:hypothetical protein
MDGATKLNGLVMFERKGNPGLSLPGSKNDYIEKNH